MPKNRLKALIGAGKPAIGTWISFADSFAVEAIAEERFDWMLIDTEHCPIGREGLRNILVALKGTSCVPVVRLTSNDPDYFKMALDLGAQGVVVPMVQSREDAERAVSACRYPPVGNRGIGPVRASRYFRHLEEYLREANDEILLAVQVETPQTVENLENILDVAGLDAIFIGPADLAGCMGLAGQTAHPKVGSAITRIIQTARARHIPFGVPTWSPEEFMNYVARGATLLLLGSDLAFLMESARANLSKARRLLQAEPSGPEAEVASVVPDADPPE